MTTDIRITLVEDARKDADWPMFSKNKVDNSEPPVSVLSISIRHPGFAGQALKTWHAAQLEKTLSEASVGLSSRISVFLINEQLRPETKLSRHKGFWKSPPYIYAPSDLERFSESLFQCGDGLRFSSAAIVDLHHLRWLTECMLDTRFIIPLFDGNTLVFDELQLKKIAIAAFPPDGCGNGLPPDRLDWPSLSNWCVAHNLVCFRKNLHLEDGHFFFDFFGPKASLYQLRNYLGKGMY